MTPLSAADAYRLWAPTYSGETVVSYLETGLVDAITPSLNGLHLLDAGCGTGRRLRGCGAQAAVGIDICPEMLAAGIGHGLPASDISTIVADVRSLPLPNGSFDVIWCRLVLGHLSECRSAYAELARVARPGATVIVSDFHPAAHRAGHRRTFRVAGTLHEVEHHVHDVTDHLDAAIPVGLEFLDLKEATVGPEVRSFYEQAGKATAYQHQVGLPVVQAVAFRRVH